MAASPHPTPSVLPPLYARWMDELLGQPIAPERSATCDSCAMVAPPTEATAGSAFYFSPETKCCTYLPQLPNFLVGRVLRDDDPDAATGRATVEKRIDARSGVTPMGLQRTA